MTNALMVFIAATLVASVVLLYRIDAKLEGIWDQTSYVAANTRK